MTPSDSPGASRGSWPSLLIILLLVLGGNQAWSWWRDQHAAELVKRHAATGSITMFTTSTCPYCEQARTWLKQHDIAWLECNVETSLPCRQRFEAQGAPGVPLMLVNGHWQLGFDTAWLAQALQQPPSPQAPIKPSAETSPRP